MSLWNPDTFDNRVLRPGWEIWERLQPKDGYGRNVAIAFDGKVVHRIVFDDATTYGKDGQDMIAKDIVDILKTLGAFRQRYEPS